MLTSCAYWLSLNCFRSRAQPPDQPSSEHQSDGNQLRAGHRSAEYSPSAGIITQELKEESGHTVDEHECADNLPIKFSPLQQPHQEEEIGQFYGGLEQLRWLEGDAKGRTRNRIRQRVVESHAPPVMRGLAIAASRREASDAPDGVPQRQSGGEGIAGS